MKAKGLFFSFSVSVLIHGAIAGVLVIGGFGRDRLGSAQQDGLTLTIVVESREPEEEQPQHDQSVPDLLDPESAEPAPVQAEARTITPRVWVESPKPGTPDIVHKVSSVLPTRPSQADVRSEVTASVPTSTPSSSVRSRASSIGNVNKASKARTAVGTYQGPAYRSNPSPLYPVEARRRRQQGEVLVGVRVSVEGKPDHVWVKQSCGFDLLDSAAVKAVADWEFEPARIGLKRMESEIEVPVRFKLKN